MSKKNESIRLLMRLWGVSIWELGDEIGISESTICRWLRTDLTEERRKKIESALNALKPNENQSAEIAAKAIEKIIKEAN